MIGINWENVLINILSTQNIIEYGFIPGRLNLICENIIKVFRKEICTYIWKLV